MTEPISAPPRSLDSPVLRESCRRPTRALYLCVGWLVVAIADAAMFGNAKHPHPWLTSGTVIVAIACLVGALVARSRRERLTEVWRDGEPIEVRFERSLFFWTSAFWCRFACDDGRVRVILRDAPDEAGATYPALRRGDWIAVQDIDGRYRLGRVRSP